MGYKIIVDSSGELTHKMKNSGVYETASLSMEVDGDIIVDDGSFDQADFLRRVAASPECPKSSCPSPERYMELFEGGEERVCYTFLGAERFLQQCRAGEKALVRRTRKRQGDLCL